MRTQTQLYNTRHESTHRGMYFNNQSAFCKRHQEFDLQRASALQ